ncbi:MAG: GH32 C-terminal domain-containing protein [Muribaculaceae bacterium]|nr:GH32 C-terminal domain-containing protein [Muribaculaceae bacterium]
MVLWCRPPTKSLYWVGSINADGTFAPDSPTPGYVELPGFAKDGYGLLSPTIYQKDGKTIVLGIVPDKLAGTHNADLGFAHAYSLPREWSLSADGKLIQKPYSGLTELRLANGFEKGVTDNGFELLGSMDMDGVNGRLVELLGEFTVGGGKSGFTLLDDGTSSLKVYYDGATGRLTVDARGLDRLVNDSRSFNGLYESSLPVRINAGERLKLNVFFGHSMLDIFVNDTYATSVRVFANAKSTEGVTAFSDTPSANTRIQGWMLGSNGGGSNSIGSVITTQSEIRLSADNGQLTYSVPEAGTLSVYTLSGTKVFETFTHTLSGTIDTSLNGLHIVEARLSDTACARKLLF